MSCGWPKGYWYSQARWFVSMLFAPSEEGGGGLQNWTSFQKNSQYVTTQVLLVLAAASCVEGLNGATVTPLTNEYLTFRMWSRSPFSFLNE
jgi:hypothetical protein